jgi:phenylpropionate dioxygenase-like ring-hydroxylating dioxygenase large terminal subunit
MLQDTALEALLAGIRQAAARAPERAAFMPPEVYTSEALLAMERARIFRREWICVGRADEIPARGDYFTTEVDATPVILTRCEDGGIAALANVCRHHGSTVATGAGKTRLFTCPYHGWSYDLDGRLQAAPGIPASADFNPAECRLPRLRHEVWQGFLYVNLDPEAAPLAPRLEGLAELIARYRVGDMRSVWREREIWNANWKVLTENFMEVYHVPVVHPTTLIPFAPIDGVELLPGADGYHFYRHRQGGDYAPQPLDPDIAIPNPDLTDHERSYAYIGGVFPSHVFSVAWDWIFWLSLQPKGPGQVKVDCGVGGPVRLPRNQPQYASFPYPALVREINAEDRIRVEGVQRGAESGFAVSGPLHRHEAPLYSLIRYLARRLSDPPP